MRISKEIYAFMAVGALAGAGGHVAFAETVGQKEAKAMAQKFFNESKNYVTGPVSYVYNGKDLTNQKLFTPFYVFNSPSGGFVVISAENKAFPILGYSLSLNFDKDRTTPMVKEILGDFSRDIEMIRYDSRIPTDAMEQWFTYPEVVFDMLKNPENDDYYPASFDDKDQVWMVRRHATEFDFEVSEPVEYGMAETETYAIEIPVEPIVTANGGGHFALTLPSGISKALVYNLAGSLLDKKTYKGTNVAHIDLAAYPNGFYVVLLIDEQGVRHAAKLYR